MGHDPWVVWVMGHVFDGSRGSWVTLYDPFAALILLKGVLIPLLAFIL